MTGREASSNGELPEPTGVEPATPLLRVITPDATDEEVAALVAVVSALAASSRPAPKPPTSAWSSNARTVRSAHHSGPGAWRGSGLPR